MRTTMQSLTSQPSEGRNTTRSRNGCWTCRSKKVKCDEARPQCWRCLRLKLFCDYRPRRRPSGIARQALQSQRWGSVSASESARSTSECFQSLLRRDESTAISTSPMLEIPSTSSVILTAASHEAIRYFRTTFARLHHTKNPDYSLYSLMFKIAEINPVVMHMVVAVCGREMEVQRSICTEQGRAADSPLWHYSRALKLMADMIGNQGPTLLDLDSACTALYLMLLYEQKHGDDGCTGLANHLNGAALVIGHYCKEKVVFLPVARRPERNHPLSLYAARLILWMVQLDTAAASHGVGSQLHATLETLLGASITTDGDGEHAGSNSIRFIDKFEQLHHFSSPLYRTVWGEEYPQNELLDDVENQNIFFLEGACVQVRFMVAQLAQLQDSAAASRQAAAVELAIDNIRNKFSDLTEVAAGLSLSTDNSHRLVANLRRVVPLFYAVLLYFLRVKSGKEHPHLLTTRQLDALRQIMNLAFQAHRHAGETAVAQLAWPLFMVALETNDDLHREWVLSRLGAISRLALNFERAYQYLVHVVDLQIKRRRRVLHPGECGLFVI